MNNIRCEAAGSDIVSAAKRSEMMSKIRSKDTAAERKVRSALHAAGFRFRLHRRDLPGTPDLVLPKLRVAVFVHGCFWHRHAGCARCSLPKSNRQFWERKFYDNVARDVRAVQKLEAAGWRVVVVWECETKKGDLSTVISRIISSS